MNIRHTLISSLLLTGCVLAAPVLLAQPNSFNSVTAEKVAEIESMHQHAMDSLLKNDFQTAIRAYSDILLMEPDDETAYTGLGQIYMIQGRYNYAHEAFENALHINPENQVALSGIRRIMDPDGTEGMVSRAEIENEPPLPAEAPRSYIAPSLPAPSPATPARMEKRVSAVKAKKIPIESVQPVQAVQIKLKYPPQPGRLGLLNAQRTQMALKNAGFYEGPVNGLVGDRTKQAIREFQQKYGIQPSGRVTPVTWTKLSEFLAF